MYYYSHPRDGEIHDRTLGSSRPFSKSMGQQACSYVGTYRSRHLPSCLGTYLAPPNGLIEPPSMSIRDLVT